MNEEQKLEILEKQINFIYKKLEKTDNLCSEALYNYTSTLLRLESMAKRLKRDIEHRKLLEKRAGQQYASRN